MKRKACKYAFNRLKVFIYAFLCVTYALFFLRFIILLFCLAIIYFKKKTFKFV